MKMNIREAQPSDLDSIRKLLEDNQLPIADVTAPLLGDFLVAVVPGLVGVVGLERFGSNALLRSLVVASDGRSRGLGRELVEKMEQRARATGVSSLWLLTNSAMEFFQGVGYTTVHRDEVPAVIKESREFAELCPASAVCMCKHL
ncbi:arsenic resistance N-acetyltransferase ArsN2 [Burkholderia multivorans]|uniref:arsenic resistance N-acetyltransferase ArsN2 n=1 Tax=Burkholderia multivorans TaxID=87883 RepID=UPI0020129066|nr:arsenic resistance N-acetyltransferase ArsN2 [Burkholderia multivorans]MDN7942439.1 arsenic resistance N-acetyltransferase ArsN2 [Burkholderia multivorans]